MKETDSIECFWCTALLASTDSVSGSNKDVRIALVVEKVVTKLRHDCSVVPLYPPVGLRLTRGCGQLLCTEMCTECSVEIACKLCAFVR